MESWIWIPYFKGCSPLRNIVAESRHDTVNQFGQYFASAEKIFVQGNASMHQQKNPFHGLFKAVA